MLHHICRLKKKNTVIPLDAGEAFDKIQHTFRIEMHTTLKIK